MDITTIIHASTVLRMSTRTVALDVGGCVVSIVNTLTGEPLSLYSALCPKHMFLIQCSNAGLQDISCNRLHRYCSERTNGSRQDVGRTRRILDHVLDKLVQIFRLKGNISSFVRSLPYIVARMGISTTKSRKVYRLVSEENKQHIYVYIN